MKRMVCAVLFFLLAGTTLAKPYQGPDYSGSYDCKGNDHQEGAYTGVVTLELVKEQSDGAYGAYRFKLEVPGFGAYPGHAASEGGRMAIYFANTNPAEKDFGTGIAQFRQGKGGKWSFTKFYYEPEYKGGNHGIEVCVQR